MKTDLVLSTFDADVPHLLDAARAADEAGFDSVWVYDHFSASVVAKHWSHHPFTLLGAIASVTQRVRLGCLVANVYNRHPVQLASALSTLSSLAPGRIWCGLGAGAGGGSMFGSEYRTIGRDPEPARQRRLVLAETIGFLRAIWAGDRFDGEVFSVSASAGVVAAGHAFPPILIGASTRETALIGAEHGDGVNLQAGGHELVAGDAVFSLVRDVRAATDGRPFDIAVNRDLDLDHRFGGDVESLIAHGVDRRTLAIRAPFDLEKVTSIGSRLAEAGL